MEANQPVQEQHRCGLCMGLFDSVEAYTAHTCPNTGFTPADPEHQGPGFAAIQQAALQRGAEAQAQPETPAQEPQTVDAVQADPELVQEQG